MTHDATVCLVCGECHSDGSENTTSCPAMLATRATDAQRGNVPPRVYSGYLNAREALRANAPRAAARGLKLVIGFLAEDQGAAPSASFSDKVAQLCDTGIIGARMRNALLTQTLSETAGESQAWALMSVAEHAFNRLYLSKSRSA